MDRPPEALRPLIIDHLLKPAHVGCGHLRQILMEGAKYRVRPALIQAFLRVFHTKRWEGRPELDYVTLGGEHGEKAVLSIEVEEHLRPFTRIPLVSPACGGRQTFINHPQVASYLREETAHFMRREHVLIPLDPGHDMEAFIAQLHAMARNTWRSP